MRWISPLTGASWAKTAAKQRVTSTKNFMSRRRQKHPRRSNQRENVRKRSTEIRTFVSLYIHSAANRELLGASHDPWRHHGQWHDGPEKSWKKKKSSLVLNSENIGGAVCKMETDLKSDQSSTWTWCSLSVYYFILCHYRGQELTTHLLYVIKREISKFIKKLGFDNFRVQIESI